jgi:PAS domain S-box-containing protein
MLFVLNHHLDLLAFVLLVLVSTAFVTLLIKRNAAGSPLPRRMIGLVLLLIAVSVLFATNAGERERDRLIQMISGVAPTYAAILNENGLGQITPATATDNPTYLRLIDLQKRLLAVNPTVADIYTLVKTPEGKCVFLVDSETDYNQNGVIDEKREERTSIGEVYDDATFIRSMQTALSGESVFVHEIQTDRWGSWVSAIEPVRDASGKVFGVVAVDFSAERWVHSILIVRVTSLLLGLVINATVLVAGFMVYRLEAQVGLTRAAEQEAKASENRLRVILDSEPECVLVVDRDGRIIQSNPAGTNLLSRADQPLLGRRVNDVVDNTQRSTVDRRLAAVFSGTPSAFELSVLATGNDQPRIWLDVHCVALRDSGGTVSSALLVARDVTARRNAEAEKEMLQRQLVDASRQAGMAEIAIGVLHNVGNVLNSVNVSVNLISQRVSQMRLGSFAKLLELLRTHGNNLGTFVTEDPRGKCLPDFLEQLHLCYCDDQKAIASELQQLTNGVDHIKEIVRMQQLCASQTSTVRLPIDPTQIMEEAIKVNLVSMERHQIQLTRDYEADLGQLPLDKHKILQILINLIANAKRATCDLGVTRRHITVSVRHVEDGQSLEFRVRDNGVGIESENLPKLFRHGFTTRDDGHGFGLHSSANAASEMNGSLRGESDGPGAGATFILTLPLRSKSTAVAA